MKRSVECVFIMVKYFTIKINVPVVLDIQPRYAGTFGHSEEDIIKFYRMKQPNINRIYIKQTNLK